MRTLLDRVLYLVGPHQHRSLEAWGLLFIFIERLTDFSVAGHSMLALPHLDSGRGQLTYANLAPILTT